MTSCAATRLAAPALSLTLTGVVSWRRPREQPLRGGGRRTAYPPEYERDRERWAFEVASAVRQTGWTCPAVRLPLCVEAEVVTGGKYDLDRIGTALLDALQRGGAIADDCRVWDIHLSRCRPGKGQAPHVAVLLGQMRED